MKKTTTTLATDSEKQCTFVHTPTGARCARERLTKGLCWAHYQQQRRGHPLSPLRDRKDLVPLAGNVMVKKDILEALKARKASGKARSVYEATQQALIAGVASWSKKAKSA